MVRVYDRIMSRRIRLSRRWANEEYQAVRLLVHQELRNPNFEDRELAMQYYRAMRAYGESMQHAYVRTLAEFGKTHTIRGMAMFVGRSIGLFS